MCISKSIKVLVIILATSFITLGNLRAEKTFRSNVVKLYDSKIDSIKNRNDILKFSPALLSHSHASEKVDVGLFYNFKELLPEERPSVPKSLSRTGFNAIGFRKLGRFTGLAKASLIRKVERKIEAGLTNDAELFYPYIVADTICVKARSETYNIESNISYKFNHGWSLGAYAGYRGEIRYTKNDPRVKNNCLKIDYALSLAKVLSRKRGSALSLDFGGILYKQDLSYGIYEHDGSQWVYVMRPFGHYNSKYSGPQTQGESYYQDYKEYFVNSTYFSPSKNILVSGKFTRGKSKFKTRKAGVYLSERLDYKGNLNYSANLFKFRRNSFFIDGSSFMQISDATENVYKEVPSYEGSPLTNLELLASNHIYDQTEVKTSASFGMRHFFDRNKLQFKFGYRLKYYKSTMEDDELEEDFISKYKNSYFTASGAYELNLFNSALVYTGELSTFYRKKSESECVVNKNIVTHGIERGYLFYKLGPKFGVSFDNAFYFRLDSKVLDESAKKSNSRLLKFSVNGSYSRWDYPEWSNLVRTKEDGSVAKNYLSDNKNTFGVALSISYIF